MMSALLLVEMQRAFGSVNFGLISPGRTLKEDADMTIVRMFVVASFFLMSLACFGQEPSSTSCTFEDGKSVVVQYWESEKKAPAMNATWAPGQKPITLMTETPIEVGGTKLAVGGYYIFLIPGQQNWKLVVNKNVDSPKYDPQGDVVKTVMESGSLSSAYPKLSLAFVHSAPKQCTLRIYFQKTGMWVDFNEQ